MTILNGIEDMGQLKKNNNFIKRLILTLTAIPLLLFFLFWPKDSHIIIMIIIILLISILGSYEYTLLVEKKGIKLPLFFLSIINSILCLLSYFYVNNIFQLQKFRFTIPLFFVFVIFITSIIQAFDIFKKNLSKSFDKIAYLLFGFFYIGLPSFLMPFIFNINFNCKKPIPFFIFIDSNGTLTGSLMALLFITTVFSNDIFAYVFGMLFGRNNVLHLEASPKKSIAGYLGGTFATFFFVFLYFIIFDKKSFLFFNPYKILDLPLHFYFILSIIASIAVPVGDLVESVIKRSCSVKDSGNIIMGRGGILDSIDSIVYFYPIFFIYLQLYFAIFL